MKIFTLLLAFSFALAACGPAAPSEDQIHTAAAEMLTANAPTATETPVPATATPEPTATPAFALFTAQAAIDAFNAARLQTGTFYPMTKDDYGIAPYVGTGIRFFIASLGPDKGGRVIAFENAEDLALLQNYYVELGRQSAAFFSWIYVHHNVLVQINGDLPEEQALQYEAALKSLTP